MARRSTTAAVEKAVTATQPAPAELDFPVPPEGERGSIKFWRDQIDTAERRKQKQIPIWRTNVERYSSEKPKLNDIRSNDITNVNTDYWNTEQKKGALIFQTPSVEMTSKDGTAPPPQITALEKFENYQLGPNEINAIRMFDAMLFDLICPAGLGPTVIGFEEVKVDVAMPTNATEPDPTDPTGMKVRLKVGSDGLPETEPVPKRIWSRFFWDRVSPADLLFPATWISLDFDKAPWLGYRVRVDPGTSDQAKWKPTSRSGVSGSSDSSISPKADREFLKDTSWKYVIWYRASWLDSSVKNPDIFRRIVFMDAKRGDPEVLEHDAPYQKLDPNGRLLRGMRGNPIHIFSLRDGGDTAYVNSDCTQGRASADEISTGRSQMVIQRRRNIPLRAFDKNGMGRKEIEQIENGEYQGLIGVRGNPDTKIKTIATAAMPAENFRFNDIAMNDNRASWGLSANTQTLSEAGRTTATEIDTIRAATETRMVKERNRVLGDVARGSEKLSALIQLFADEDMLLPVLGPEATKAFLAFDWDAQAGRFHYTLRPDSSIRIDAAEEFERDLRTYNLVARDQYFDRRGLLRKMTTARGLPATDVVEPPKQGPDMPKPTLSFKAEDLQNPFVIEVLAQYGIVITVPPPAPPAPPGMAPAGALPGGAVPGSAPAGAAPGAAASAILQHPGVANQAEVLSKHEHDRSGAKPGPASSV